jgi:hypothetical protein
MGGIRAGILGTDASARGGSDDVDDILGGGDPPGPLGVDDADALSTGKVTDVRKDWDSDNPETGWIDIPGTTIDEIYRALQPRGEWGEGGGNLTTSVSRDSSGDLTVTVHANLIRRLPRWQKHDDAPPAAQQAWDRMFRKLIIHENRHVDIAAEEADKLAGQLPDKTSREVDTLLAAARDRLSARQKKLDHDTDHGRKEGVPFGDVMLDISRT